MGKGRRFALGTGRVGITGHELAQALPLTTAELGAPKRAAGIDVRVLSD